MSNTERTFIMIKPDGVHRGLVGEIIKRFEQKGYKLVAMKFEQVMFKSGFRIRIGFGFNRASGSGSVFGIRIRIQEGKNDPQK
jgi:hypothetical protein